MHYTSGVGTKSTLRGQGHGKASLNPEGLGWDEVLGEGRYCGKRATYQLGVWRIRALYKLPLAPAAKSFDARCVLQASCPVVLLCKTVCNQLINVAHYCRGKIYFFPRFQPCGCERSRCPSVPTPLHYRPTVAYCNCQLPHKSKAPAEFK